MIVHLHQRFEKQYKKLPTQARQKAKERLQLFSVAPTDMRLNNHALSGKYTGYRSISATGDIRMIYKLVDDTHAHFVRIGSHSELYG